jgi:hypothetical protein
MYWIWKKYITKQFREIIYTKFREIFAKCTGIWKIYITISRKKVQRNFAEFREISRNFAKLKSLSSLFRISRNKKSYFATTLSGTFSPFCLKKKNPERIPWWNVYLRFAVLSCILSQGRCNQLKPADVSSRDVSPGCCFQAYGDADFNMIAVFSPFFRNFIYDTELLNGMNTFSSSLCSQNSFTLNVGAKRITEQDRKLK